MFLRINHVCRTLQRFKGVSHGPIRENSSSASEAPRTIFSGIQPTGIPHLGNYLGALSNWVKLQNRNPQDKLIFSIVGWHALTLPQNPKELAASRRDMLAVLLAIGIDPKRSILFHQDSNAMHTELAWILSCITPTGKLRRMTSWKTRLAQSRNANDESEVDESMLNAGLLTYPVLQAADILLYQATHVPVGEDQRQHLELSRDIADSFNRTFTPMFPLPTAIITPSKRILSLKDPSAKMSKSAPDAASRILFTDSAAQIAAKVRSAVTDSIASGVTYDPDARPGTSNLLAILAACAGEDVHDVAARCVGMNHGALKAEVAAAVEALMAGPRAEFERIRGDVGYLDQVAQEGAVAARELSARTMVQVRASIGFELDLWHATLKIHYLILSGAASFHLKAFPWQLRAASRLRYFPCVCLNSPPTP